jgi:hypothetical protein
MEFISLQLEKVVGGPGDTNIVYDMQIWTSKHNRTIGTWILLDACESRHVDASWDRVW